jgi:hypothetical protein
MDRSFWGAPKKSFVVMQNLPQKCFVTPLPKNVSLKHCTHDLLMMFFHQNKNDKAFCTPRPLS